ncbi:hypothetical protein KFE25_010417 [Diacronema lutheri]|uniref:Uncharacterized protein n=1 Tax=Diacronema lutheri TaxID=2081491 RepID=A0A8J6C5G5_DIALT|nr:hypothetical protein KFE25_010417 [Diacronema lutheri]
MATRATRLSRRWAATLAGESAAAASAPRVFINLVVERGFMVYPPDPVWRSSYEARAEAWHHAYRQEYPKAFFDKLDPRAAPRSSYLAAIERVLAQHEGAPNPHDADERSFKRQLTRRLYLLARYAPPGGGERRNGDDGGWAFPRAEMSATDGSVTMRSAVLALARAQLGPQLKVLHLSRAPIAHLPSAAPTAAAADAAADGGHGGGGGVGGGGGGGGGGGAGGAALLDVYFKLKHVVGNAQPGDRAEPLYAEWADFAWLTKEEALERLRGQPVAALASRMLLD